LELAPGRITRIVREPHFGKIARVLELPEELAEIQTQARVKIAKVQIVETGEKLVVPRANLEIFES